MSRSALGFAALVVAGVVLPDFLSSPPQAARKSAKAPAAPPPPTILRMRLREEGSRDSSAIAPVSGTPERASSEWAILGLPFGLGVLGACGSRGPLDQKAPAPTRPARATASED